MSAVRLLLDLFCGAGGAAMGYHRAGFHVIGVDHRPQPRYPFPLVRACALDVLEQGHVGGQPLETFAAIHASPPCQRFSSITRVTKRSSAHPDLIGPTRDALAATGLPFVIENVEGAPLRNPVLICGSMFDPPLDVRRHRLFETNWPLHPPAWPCRHKLWAPRFRGADKRGRAGRLTRVVPVYGGTRYAGDGQLRRRAMQIDWMSGQELTQAIPPAYTEMIGSRLLAYLAEGSRVGDGQG